MGLNVLGDEEDDDNEDELHPATSRAAVNRALLSEQAALRKRAQEAVYDYDGEYDTFKQPEKVAPKQEERKSRYIGGLLKAADQRKRERDIVYERKVAKEQAEEDAEVDFRGKDKFVTAAYKKKLEERELWLAEEESKRKAEEANDVTKQTGGLAMANFYGNMNRNVAMGGGEPENDRMEIPNTGDKEKKPSESRKTSETHQDSPQLKGDFTVGFEMAKGGVDEKEMNLDEDSKDPAAERLRKRQRREQKIKEARERYFERHGIKEGSQ